MSREQSSTSSSSSSSSPPKGSGEVFLYRDFSSLTEDNSLLTDRVAGVVARKDNYFPVKLHYVLCEMEKDGLQDIASWQPHGRCFIVHDPEKFVQQVLILWFRQTKFQSFQRQLNIYGFTRITSGPDSGGYFHEMFLRGKQFLAQRILPKRIKGKGPRKVQKSEKKLPNLYGLPFLPAHQPTNNVPPSLPQTTEMTMVKNTNSRPNPQVAVPVNESSKWPRTVSLENLSMESNTTNLPVQQQQQQHHQPTIREILAVAGRQENHLLQPAQVSPMIQASFPEIAPPQLDQFSLNDVHTGPASMPATLAAAFHSALRSPLPTAFTLPARSANFPSTFSMP